MSKFIPARSFTALTACVLLCCAGLTPVQAVCPGDIDGDFDIDLSDLAHLLGNYGQWGMFWWDGDFTGDGYVGLDDLAFLLANYGLTCEPPETGMVSVPGGWFEMGDSFVEGGPDELPVHDVYLNPYYIDKYEVTNQQYADALNWAYTQGGMIEVTDGKVYKYNNGMGYLYCDLWISQGSYSRITWNGSTFGITDGKEYHPMLHVTWYGSVAYCNWCSAMANKPLCYDLIDEDPPNWACNFVPAGYRLPTEAEWEKAAGWDPDEQRHFRFGEHTDGCGTSCLDAQRANYWDSDDPYEGGFDPDTTPVGFYNGELHYKVDLGWPESRTSYQTQNAQSYYGCYDMSGNVREWCSDRYSVSFYQDYVDSGSPPNPTGPGSGSQRVLRGGSWYSIHPNLCRSAVRFSSPPNSRGHSLGFRCVAGTP